MITVTQLIKKLEVLPGEAEVRVLGNDLLLDNFPLVMIRSTTRSYVGKDGTVTDFTEVTFQPGKER